MPRVYTVGFENQSWVTGDTDIDIIELDAAAEKPIAVKAWRIKTNSETGETQEEWLRYKWVRGNTTSGSTPDVSPTPVPLSPNDSAAGFTAECINSTPASAGTAVDVHPGDAFQVRNGDEVWLAPEDWIWTSGTSLLCMRGPAAPVDDVTFSLTVWVVEVP